MDKDYAQIKLFREEVTKNKTIIQKKFEILFGEKQTTMGEFMIKLYGGNEHAR